MGLDKGKLWNVLTFQEMRNQKRSYEDFRKFTEALQGQSVDLYLYAQIFERSEPLSSHQVLITILGQSQKRKATFFERHYEAGNLIGKLSQHRKEQLDLKTLSTERDRVEYLRTHGVIVVSEQYVRMDGSSLTREQLEKILAENELITSYPQQRLRGRHFHNQ